MTKHAMSSLHIMSGDVVEYQTETGTRQARIVREADTEGYVARVGGERGFNVYVSISNFLRRVPRVSVHQRTHFA